MLVHFLAHISKWELVCKFGVIFHIFIISCLCSRFHVWNQWFFYSVITFSYTKCFVHSYTVDVIFTLSYWKENRHHEDLYVLVLCLLWLKHVCTWIYISNAIEVAWENHRAWCFVTKVPKARTEEQSRFGAGLPPRPRTIPSHAAWHGEGRVAPVGC